MDSAKNCARFDWTCDSVIHFRKKKIIKIILLLKMPFRNKPVKFFNLLYTRGAKLWLQRFCTAWYKSSRADFIEVEFCIATTASSSFCQATSCKKSSTVRCIENLISNWINNLVILRQFGEFFHRLDDNFLDISSSWFDYCWRCFRQSIRADQGREVGPLCLLHGRLFCLHLIFVTVLSLDSNQFPGRLTHIEPISGNSLEL